MWQHSRMMISCGTYRVNRPASAVVVPLNRRVGCLVSCGSTADIADIVRDWSLRRMVWLSLTWDRRCAVARHHLTTNQLQVTKSLVKAPMSTGCQPHLWSRDVWFGRLEGKTGKSVCRTLPFGFVPDLITVAPLVRSQRRHSPIPRDPFSVVAPLLTAGTKAP